MSPFVFHCQVYHALTFGHKLPPSKADSWLFRFLFYLLPHPLLWFFFSPANYLPARSWNRLLPDKHSKSRCRNRSNTAVYSFEYTQSFRFDNLRAIVSNWCKRKTFSLVYFLMFSWWFCKLLKILYVVYSYKVLLFERHTSARRFSIVLKYDKIKDRLNTITEPDAG